MQLEDCQQKIKGLVDDWSSHPIDWDSDPVLADLGLDSMDAMELVMMTEEAFDLDIPVAQVSTWNRVSDIQRDVWTLIAEKQKEGQ
ncbi:acyl carrier protein [Acidithiobacillus thiooxidans]|uniref:acyl carrier protein n=1 Tax=Acidithiobacillus thiooxidans TaxID=930 RepID=UPI001C06616B|nr:acyl carrier protein [Acidithiobacillus thiooxidans]MBU2840260.1 acyl carrier protein [Acidithiobacillus thiooxidans]MBU2844088.1 acyl carrier protein [Acidithiobacillus thiooxidans]